MCTKSVQGENVLTLNDTEHDYSTFLPYQKSKHFTFTHHRQRLISSSQLYSNFLTNLPCYINRLSVKHNCNISYCTHYFWVYCNDVCHLSCSVMHFAQANIKQFIFTCVTFKLLSVSSCLRGPLSATVQTLTTQMTS